MLRKMGDGSFLNLPVVATAAMQPDAGRGCGSLYAESGGFFKGRVARVFEGEALKSVPGGQNLEMGTWVWSYCNPLKFQPPKGTEVGFASAARPR